LNVFCSFIDGSSLYRAFLLREFSNENLEFWLAVEEYKNSKPQKMAAKAQQIYNDFVAVQASKEVRLHKNQLNSTHFLLFN
jgi:regulator of G-protein signaling 3/regulator of G-protein signaling